MRQRGTKEWAKAFLPAVRKLIKWYGTFDNSSKGYDISYGKSHIECCPLCDAAAKFQPKGESWDDDILGCTYCPWNKRKGVITTEEREPCMKANYDEAMVSSRLRRLREYEKNMVKILES